MNGEDLKCLTVMIVDDDKEMRFIIKSALEDMGVANVIESQDAKHALHIIRYSLQAIDLILCDWNLPGESGMDFLHQIQEENCRIPFFIVSGRRDSESVMLAKNAHVAGYILKPFSPAELEARIHTALHHMHQMKACEN